METTISYEGTKILLHSPNGCRDRARIITPLTFSPSTGYHNATPRSEVRQTLVKKNHRARDRRLEDHSRVLCVEINLVPLPCYASDHWAPCHCVQPSMAGGVPPRYSRGRRRIQRRGHDQRNDRCFALRPNLRTGPYMDKSVVRENCSLTDITGSDMFAMDHESRSHLAPQQRISIINRRQMISKAMTGCTGSRICQR